MTKPDVIFMMGPSGVGKGTQSTILADREGYFHWENGAVLRSMGDRRLKNGEILSEFIASGRFPSDEDIMELVWNKIQELPADKHIVFDGFPRTLFQAQQIAELFKGKGKTMATIYLDAHEEELVRRLSERAKTQGRSDDHDMEAIKRRLAQFEELTKPALEFLRGHTDFYDVDSRPAIPEVARTIEQILAAYA